MYAKLFSSILDSSLWTADPPTRILFLTMLAMADREGRIFASRSGLARRAVIGTEDFDRAMALLEGPDTESSDLTRNPENGGRRIEGAEGGWQIINYQYYRDLRDSDERRHGDRERQRKHREKLSRAVTKGHKASRSVARSNTSDSEAYSEADTESVGGVRDIRPAPTPANGRFKPPTISEVRAYIAEKGLDVNPTKWFAHYTANGWMVGRNHMKSWKAAVWTWANREGS